jgi:diguanylate cyclase (GGDEF)-like protein
LLWYRYVDYAIHKDRAHIDKFKLWLLVPFAVNAVLAVFSPWFGWLFVIDTANVYSRGSLFFVNAAIQYGYLMAATIAIIKNRDGLRKANYWPTLLFIVPPAVGGAIQIFLYGLLLVWPMVTISVLMVFVFVQFERANTDYLTGLYNRREYESYLRGLERRKKRVGILAGVILDLDRFKSINDLFGHEMGDLALQQMADTIRNAFSPGDFIARVGGDEFAILYFVEKESQALYPLEKLKDAVSTFNKSRRFDFDLEMSIGAAIYRPEEDESIVKFMKRLDDLMYQSKAGKSPQRVR